MIRRSFWQFLTVASPRLQLAKQLPKRFVFTVDRFRVVFNLNDTITLLEFRNVSKQLLFLLAVGFRIEDKAYVAVL